MKAHNSKFSSCRFLQMTTARNVSSPVIDTMQIHKMVVLVYRRGTGEEKQKVQINTNASLNSLNHRQIRRCEETGP